VVQSRSKLDDVEPKAWVFVPHLANIRVYPVKSLDPSDVAQARVLASGALEHDRRLALVDHEGKFINSKRTPLTHELRSRWDPVSRRLTLTRTVGLRRPLEAFPFHDDVEFQVDAQRGELEAWLSAHFSLPARLVEDAAQGFPDDLDAAGPTVISTGTLETIAGWYPGLSLEEVRRRFRANLEIGDVEPFWEDRLYSVAGETVLFRVGDVTFAGNNPCQRCVVPSRDTHSGEVWPAFNKQFTKLREATLPPWAERSRFNHFFRLSVNTKPACDGGVIRVGDPIEVIG
jgi:uncharacterized protein YcbX